MPEEYIEEEKVRYGILKGEVRGYKNKRSTRGISPAKVFVKILLPGKSKPRVYSPYEQKDMLNLRDEFPDVYRVIAGHKEMFGAHDADPFGRFELKVPVGWWSYVASAYVENKDYDHMDEGGNDGMGTKEPIRNEHFNRESMKIEGIVIPVKDSWWKISTGTRSGDPKTKPKTVPLGIVPDDVFEMIEKHRTEKGETS
ncbi:MAG: hypothetical protein V1729_03715 [Candidatus Woesearchaeota archaeon]